MVIIAQHSHKGKKFQPRPGVGLREQMLRWWLFVCSTSEKEKGK